MSGDTFDNFFEVLTEELDKTNKSSLPDSAWVCKHTQHPNKLERSWSFKHHEFQQDIMDCDAPTVSCMKCSQIGVSEIFLRKALTRSVRNRMYVTIYVFPTTGDVKKLVAHRVDSMIENNPIFSNAIDPNLDNLSLKKLGNSYLYFDGSQKPGISVPADAVIVDEVDFCVQTNLTTFQSRLGHKVEGEESFTAFSTPTVRKFGVHRKVTISSNATYMVKHDKCGQWTALDFFEDVVLPKYDDHLSQFRAEHALDPKYNLKDAYVKCPKCNHPISPENMIDADKRKWVHRKPDLVNIHAGFNCSPLDVYAFNPPSRTLNQITGYDRYEDWVNFKVGLPDGDASNLLLEPEIGEAQEGGTNYLGIDVGKTCWFVVINVSNKGLITIIHLQSVTLKWLSNGRTSALQAAYDLRRKFNILGIVIDSLPDLTLALSISSIFFNSYYSEYTLNPIQDKEGDGNQKIKSVFHKSGKVVKVWRTGVFNEVSKKLSQGHIVMPDGIVQGHVFNDHLKGLKKEVDIEGREKWVKVGADHYAHALAYACVAAGNLTTDPIAGKIVGGGSDILSATMHQGKNKRRNRATGSIVDRFGRSII